jgi:hypothetical protein
MARDVTLSLKFVALKHLKPDQKQFYTTHLFRASFTNVSSSSPRIRVAEMMNRNANKRIVFCILAFSSLNAEAISTDFYCLCCGFYIANAQHP